MAVGDCFTGMGVKQKLYQKWLTGQTPTKWDQYAQKNKVRSAIKKEKTEMCD